MRTAILITGRMRAGKSAAASYMREVYGFRCYPIAAKLKELYTELVKIYLTEVPSFTLMYRPQSFHTVNESVWTNFPHAEDGTNPPVPPLDLTDGWSIAGLYNLVLVEE